MLFDDSVSVYIFATKLICSILYTETVSLNSTVKGKSYKTKDDREPKEISREKYFEKNYILSSKPSRSVRGGFSLRKLQDHRLGSGGRRRVDRPQSFEDHDEEERGCPPLY